MKSTKRNNEEEKLQRAIVEYLHVAAAPGCLWWHCPNSFYSGGARGAIQWRKFEAMGARAGVSDLMFIRNGKPYLIELKSPKGVLSLSQRRFLDDATRAGAYTQVCHGLEEFRFQAKDWGLIR